MSEYWEINGKASTPEDVFEKIFAELDAPGVLIFGADQYGSGEHEYGLKYRIGRLFERMERYYPHGRIVLSGGESCSHEARHEAVKWLKDVRDAKNVVGVHAKPIEHPLEEETQDGFTNILTRLIERQKSELENNPPTADGLAYLITVSERDS